MVSDPNRGTGRTQRQLEQLLVAPGRSFYVCRTEATACRLARRFELMREKCDISGEAPVVEFCGAKRDLRGVEGNVFYDHACAMAL